MSHDDFQPPDPLNTEEIAELRNTMSDTDDIVQRLMVELDACMGAEESKLAWVRGCFQATLEDAFAQLRAENQMLKDERLGIDTTLAILRAHWVSSNGADSISVGALDTIVSVIEGCGSARKQTP